MVVQEDFCILKRLSTQIAGPLALETGKEREQDIAFQMEHSQYANSSKYNPKIAYLHGVTVNCDIY